MGEEREWEFKTRVWKWLIRIYWIQDFEPINSSMSFALLLGVCIYRFLLISSLSFFLPPGLLQVEYLIKRDRERLIEPKAGLSSRRAEVFPRQVTPNTYRDVLTEIKTRQIFNLIVDIKHLPLFFRIVSSSLIFLFRLDDSTLLGILLSSTIDSIPFTPSSHHFHGPDHSHSRPTP